MILPGHFEGARSRDEARKLFATSVTKVEVEVFSYCNRTCWFCPNSFIDRRSQNNYMDEALYLRLLSELAEIDYSHAITYSRYNEPLADRAVILRRIRQAREILPKAVLSTHSNGDYLTRDYLDELRDAGLNQIFIMTYLGADEEFSDERILSRLTSKAVDLGLRCQFTMAIHGVRYNATLDYPGMNVRMEGRNYAEVGTDRGKLVQLAPYVRTAWCSVVFEDLYVDWNGKVVPCCNIRSDAPSHGNYVIEDLSSGISIFEAWAGSKLAAWRRSLFNFDEKTAPCDSCRYQIRPENSEIRSLVALINRAFIGNPSGLDS